MAFAWLQPVPDATWLAVAEPSYTELYRVSSGEPVRITTTRVDVGRSRARFDIAEYDREGAELLRRVLEVSVAG